MLRTCLKRPIWGYFAASSSRGCIINNYCLYNLKCYSLDYYSLLFKTYYTIFFCQIKSIIKKSMAAENEATSALYSKLSELQIKYETFTHPPTKTNEELLTIFKEMPFLQVKNVFLIDKKKRLFMVSASIDSDINLKSLSKQLSAPNFRFAGEDYLRNHLQVIPGSLTPLASINDSTHAVTFVFDDILQNTTQRVLVHPLHNEATLALSGTDLVKFVESTGHTITWVKLNETDMSVPIQHSLDSKPVKSNKATDKKNANTDTNASGTEMLGITVSKNDQFSEWYSQVITRSDMLEYYDISGCYILRPWSYFIWESIQEFMNLNLKSLGVQNCYFPMFVTKNRLETEKDHVEGFSPEVAWVTKYGDSDLTEPIAIRPTSETIMYPAFSKWIRSHRDLPLQLNQWCPIVRWEFKQPTPFIRTREFLWQEGHTVHSTDSEAEEFTFKILNLYSRIYEELLAIPVVKGVKSEKEKFAGGKMTATVEAFIPANGRAVQAATSHHLGTNFSKMFGIEFEDRDRKKQYAHQTSWGFTTRSLGLAIMIHGDDKGMVMPPKVAPVQLVIIPILYKEEGTIELLKQCDIIYNQMTSLGIRTKFDDRDNYTPGWKYNDWETKGVCIRMEIGPRDMKNQMVQLVRRDTNEKSNYSWESLSTVIPQLLTDIHSSMLNKAKQYLNESIIKVTNWSDVMPALNAKKLVLAPWCEDPASEEKIKAETTRLSLAITERDTDEQTALTGAMKALCIPLEQPPMPEGTLCFITQTPAKRWCLFGRSY